MKSVSRLAIVVSLIACSHGYAASTSPQYQFDKMNGAATVSTDYSEQKAQSWGLNATDYQRYQTLMQTTRYGLYYKDKDVDPNLVLAFSATNQSDYDKFLRQAVKNDHERIERELKVSLDYQAMAKKLYPNEKPIMDRS